MYKGAWKEILQKIHEQKLRVFIKGGGGIVFSKTSIPLERSLKCSSICNSKQTNKGNSNW